MLSIISILYLMYDSNIFLQPCDQVFRGYFPVYCDNEAKLIMWVIVLAHKFVWTSLAFSIDLVEILCV